MKYSVFWDTMACSPVKVNRRFGGACCLHPQGWRLNEARHQHEAGSKQSRGTPPPRAWNLLWFCYCCITSRQWLSLFRFLVLTVVLGVIATDISVVCEVRTKYLKLATKHSRAVPHSLTSVVVSSGSENPHKGDPWEDREIPRGSYPSKKIFKKNK
jgi:hypothetical protein